MIVLLGETKAELGGSEFQKVIHGVTEGRPPILDLAAEKKLLDMVLHGIQQGLVASAHDLSEGGLAAAVAESCISGGIGARVSFECGVRADHALFSESQSRILLSVSPDRLDALKQLAGARGVPYQVLGEVEGNELRIDVNAKPAIQLSVRQLEKVWKDAIPCLMK